MTDKDCVLWWNNKSQLSLLLNQVKKHFNTDKMNVWSEFVIGEGTTSPSEEIKKTLRNARIN